VLKVVDLFGFEKISERKQRHLLTKLFVKCN